MENARIKKPGVGISLFTFVGVAVIIGYGLIGLKLDAHVPIALASTFTAIVGMCALKIPWNEIEKGIMEAVNSSMIALLILVTIGMLIGSWVQAGVVPGMIYYGFNILTPGIFFLSTLLICSIVSIATGSSWGVGGTVGVALMGIAAGLNLPAPLTAGVIISGAYLGDKMSPLSDTTNLAPAVSGSNLFDHIRAMMWTTVPSYLIVVLITIVLGMQYATSAEQFDNSRIVAIQSVMAAEFAITPLCIVPPLIVIVLAVKQFPAIPSMIAGTAAGSVMALFQGRSLADVLGAINYGYHPDLSAKLAAATGGDLASLMAKNGLASLSPQLTVEVGKLLSSLLERGGIQSMMWSLSLIMIALVLGGTMERCGFLEALLQPLLLKVRTVGSFVALVMGSSFATNVFLGDQYLGIVVPGRMFKTPVEKSGLSPRMLSRTLEDCGTLTAVMVPWTGCGAFQAAALGVATMEYAPYAFLNYITPIVALIMTYMGIGIYWGANGKDHIEKRTHISFKFEEIEEKRASE